MWKLIKEILIWVAILSYLIISFSFTEKAGNKIHCVQIDIIITDTTNNYFVEKDDILKLLEENKIRLLGKRLDSVCISSLEILISKHSSIKKAEVYKQNNGVVKIEIEQRNPILRIFNTENESFYLDESGKIMELSQKYTANTLVFSGNIKISPNKDNNKTIDNNEILNSIYTIGHFIYTSPQWKSFIVQSYVTENNEFELVPRIGNQLILFGSTEKTAEKFKKLEALYKSGFNNLGWTKYKTINLKYEKQVICTKI
jgi:cell division protein FtsQ